MTTLTVDQVRALIEVDSSLRVFVLENDGTPEYVRRTVRRDLERLREAFPTIAWTGVPR